MNRRVVLSSLLLSLFVVAVCFAADGFIGTWKLNEAKSKLGPGVPKNDTVVYEAAGDSVKVTISGVGADGKPNHTEWTGKYDGKDYPVTGSAAEDARSVKKIDDHTLHVEVKKGGKVVLTAHVVLSADGKTRTVTTTATDANGKKVTGTAVYDKE
jgi:hypothetical protein